jgi:hypothetical protein
MVAPSTRALGAVTSANTGTPSFAEPAGAQPDDIIICAWFQDDARTSATPPTPPAGFSLPNDAPQLNNPLGSSPDHSLQVFIGRRSVVGAGPYTFTIVPGTGGATPFCEGRAAAVQDVFTGSPFYAGPQDGNTSGSSNVSTAPAVSTTNSVNDCYAFYVATNWNGGTWTPPSGYVEQWDANNHIITIADATLATPQTTSPQAVNTASARMNAWVATFLPLSSVVTVTGSATMSLGDLDADATGQVTVLGTGSMPLGGLTTSANGLVTVLGAAIANLGSLSQTATGQRTTNGTATMNLGRLAMNATNVTGGPVILPDDFYTPGPCRPYDYVSFCDIPLESAAVSGYALQAASEIIYYATAQRFDTCQTTLRMCRRTCYGSYFPYGWWEYGYGGPRPALINGQWYNIVCGACGDGCSCSIVSEVMLPGPIQEIVQVTVDGVVLEEGVDYRLDDYRKLVRLGGNQWPICNDLNLGITEVGTWSVTFIGGEPLPALGKLAVGELFCDILADLTGGDCKVPYTVTQLTRQGVTLTFETIQEALKEGFQGLKYTDKFIATYNPDHIRARPYMIDMDGNEPGRVTGTTII